MDPLWRFPYHISADIVHLSLPEPDLERPGRYINRLLDLTNVSRHWERLILSESQLWTTIVADRSIDDSLYKLALCCSLSAQRPLVVKFDMRLATVEIQNILMVLRQHRERIVTLNPIAEKYVLDEDLERYLRPLEEILGPLPALKWFELGATSYAGDVAQSEILTYAAMHPHLTELGGIDVSTVLLQTEWTQSMRRVSSYMDFLDLIPHLAKLKNAEEGFFYETYTYPVIFPDAMPPQLHWRKVELLEQIVGVSRFLLPALTTTLVDFKVTIDTEELLDLFHHLHPATQLRHLCMILIITDSVYNIPPNTTFNVLTQLNTFEIRISTSAWMCGDTRAHSSACCIP